MILGWAHTSPGDKTPKILSLVPLKLVRHAHTKINKRRDGHLLQPKEGGLTTQYVKQNSSVDDNHPTLFLHSVRRGSHFVIINLRSRAYGRRPFTVALVDYEVRDSRPVLYDNDDFKVARR